MLPIQKDLVKKSWIFTSNMLKNGHIRENRSGGNLKRDKKNKAIDTFQGKLAEFAFWDMAKNNKILLSEPDCSILSKGEYDNGDFIYNNKNISIKSIKPNAQFLLLETKNFNKNGYEIIFNPPKKNDFTCVLKIIFKPKNIYKNLFVKDFIDNIQTIDDVKNNLHNFYFSFPGYLTFEDFKKIVDSKQIMYQGNTLGKYCKLDADNYYCRLNDLNKSETIWEKI
mgnify:CR=1 FL=1